MSAIPVIPASVTTLDQLDRWIDREAPKANTLAAQLRMRVAVMDWVSLHRPATS